MLHKFCTETLLFLAGQALLADLRLYGAGKSIIMERKEAIKSTLYRSKNDVTVLGGLQSEKHRVSDSRSGQYDYRCCSGWWLLVMAYFNRPVNKLN